MSGPVIGIAGAGYLVQRFWGELPVRGDPSHWPARGVQWHPELDPTGPALFGRLLEQACRLRLHV